MPKRLYDLLVVENISWKDSLRSALDQCSLGNLTRIIRSMGFSCYY